MAAFARTFDNPLPAPNLRQPPSCATGLTAELEKSRTAARSKSPRVRVKRVREGKGKGMKSLNLALQGSHGGSGHRADGRTAALHESLKHHVEHCPRTPERTRAQGIGDACRIAVQGGTDHAA